MSKKRAYVITVDKGGEAIPVKNVVRDTENLKDLISLGLPKLPAASIVTIEVADFYDLDREENKDDS